MIEQIERYAFIRLAAARLNISTAIDTPLESLALNEYTAATFTNLELVTVGDVIEVYCLHRPTPGIGKKSWDDFFNALE